jgi:hypothetical protein
MEDTNPFTKPTVRPFSRRSLLKGSMTLTAAAMAAPAALTIAAIESAPVVERAAVAVEQWFEEVGGI